jgi:DNA modification methylase
LVVEQEARATNTKIYEGDALNVLRSRIATDSIDCVVTSPPYWQLRDYMVHGQLGLEPTPEEYIQNLCAVFDEVWRVLKPAGTCWVNLGDTYASSGMCNNGFNERWHGKKFADNKQGATDQQRPRRPKADVPRKSLCLVPFRFAVEMVKRGWVVRNVIIWHKPNCMPSSATDRFTIDFEYLFLFVKSSNYCFESQYEPHADCTKLRLARFRHNQETFDPKRHKQAFGHPSPFEILQRICENGLRPEGRNRRCVWRIATQPFQGAHFATFPEKLVEIPIEAGCPRFVCAGCGKRQRNMQRITTNGRLSTKQHTRNPRSTRQRLSEYRIPTACNHLECACDGSAQPGVVLDPFCGSGTTGLVAQKLCRRFIGIELNRTYVKMAHQRLRSSTRNLTRSSKAIRNSS